LNSADYDSAVAYRSHSIIVSKSPKEAKNAIHRRIGEYLSNNHLVIYVAEPKPSQVIQQMSKVMRKHNDEKEIEEYIASGALTVIDRDEFYSPKNTRQLEPQNLLNSWYSLIMQARRNKPRSKRVVAIGNPSIFLEFSNGKDYRDNLIGYENKIGKRSDKPVEAICWYNISENYPKLSFSQLVSILNAHQAVIHNGWLYREWHPNAIVEFVHYGIDKILGEGASSLISKTLRMVYRIDEQEILVSQPELFEEKLSKIMGETTTKLVFEIISDALTKEISFNRIQTQG
jgi:hypothetical protein